MNSIKLQILVINDDDSEIELIKNQLERDMRVPWNLTQHDTAEDAGDAMGEADIIILKTESEDLTRVEVFDDVQDMVYETPIIVLGNVDKTQRQGAQAEFATALMDRGAADVIVRGHFARMVDAIEFAMIRQKISTAVRKDADQALSESERQGRSDIKTSQRKIVNQAERHKQIIRMFLGGYSTDQVH